ncbi:3'-5' DNA helicase [Ascosphaera pollenicola]|nr:3'-5' DNA helicase [Ascosphaera pollenicola]
MPNITSNEPSSAMPSAMLSASMRIVPTPNYSTTTSNTARASATSQGAPSAPGIHDTLRANLTSQPPSSQKTASSHPLEARLTQWRETQETMKMTNLRRLYGLAEPIRRGMELKMVRDADFKPAVLGGGKGPSLHEDILTLGGRDTECMWEDIFTGDDLREPASFHDEMEHRLKIN